MSSDPLTLDIAALWQAATGRVPADTQALSASSKTAPDKSALFAIPSWRPLVHVLTNSVAANETANLLLALGGTPIFAEAEEESADVSASADAVVLNLGMPHAGKYRAAAHSLATARERGLPLVIDPVGIGVSDFRRASCVQLYKELGPGMLLRGNAAELSKLAQLNGLPHISAARTRGVDSVEIGSCVGDSGELTTTTPVPPDRRLVEGHMTRPDYEPIDVMLGALCRQFGGVTVMSGSVDYIHNDRQMVAIHNGCVEMAALSGLGCLSDALCGLFMARLPERHFEAAILAAAAMGIAGETARERCLNEPGGKDAMRYRRLFMESLASLRAADIAGRIRCERVI